jgi:DNA-binding transcriptional ArsR family regulator
VTETLLQRSVAIQRIVALDHRSAQALADPVRIRVLEILAHRPMSAEELTKALGSEGRKKAVTTVRHHLDTLKTAGLIEATRMVEVRGAVMKYYAPTVKAFSFEPTLKLEDKHARLVFDTSTKLIKILKAIHGDKKFVAEFEKHVESCGLCKRKHFREFAALEIVNHALAKAIESKEYNDFVVADKDSKAAKSVAP